MSDLEHGAAFKLVGGRLCLDFVNSVSGRHTRPGSAGPEAIDREWLVGWTDLVRWAEAAGVVSGAAAASLAQAGTESPVAAARVLARARAVREAIYRVFRAAIAGVKPPADDLELMNRELARAREQERLVFADRRFQLTWTATTEGLDQLLWPVLRSAADLLTSGELARVVRCAGDRCGWLFLDTSRNRSRRWCDMADCGNLAKVRRFRRRG